MLCWLNCQYLHETVNETWLLLCNFRSIFKIYTSKMMQQFELHLIFRQDTIFCYLNDSQNNLQALGFLAPKCKHNKKRIFASLNDNPLKRQAQNIFANQLMIFTIHFCYFDSAQQPKADLKTCSY